MCTRRSRRARLGSYWSILAARSRGIRATHAGAIHMLKADMAARIPSEFPAGTEFVVYCWGPGCNGAQRAGLIISELGYPVKEMIGGFEYWAREGMPVDAVVVGLVGHARDGRRHPSC